MRVENFEDSVTCTTKMVRVLPLAKKKQKKMIINWVTKERTWKFIGAPHAKVKGDVEKEDGLNPRGKWDGKDAVLM